MVLKASAEDASVVKELRRRSAQALSSNPDSVASVLVVRVAVVDLDVAGQEAKAVVDIHVVLVIVADTEGKDLVPLALTVPPLLAEVHPGHKITW